MYAEEIVETVLKVYGEIAACKIAHSQKLGRVIPKEVLDQEYRSEKALTVALMGLMAEDTIIAQRLGKLGAKRKPVNHLVTERGWIERGDLSDRPHYKLTMRGYERLKGDPRR